MIRSAGVAFVLATAVSLVGTAAPARGQSAVRMPHRYYGSAGVFFRRDGGNALGRSYRQSYLDRTLDLGFGGDLLGPRLGNYSLTGGLGWLTQRGEGPGRSDARQRLDARVQLLPQSFVTANGFYSGGWSNLPTSSLESARSNGWGGGVGARLLPGAQSSADFEKRDDRFGGASNAARTLRLHHGQNLSRGANALNASWDYLERDLEAGYSGVEERARRHTGRVDGRLDLARLGRVAAGFQLDRERLDPLRGPIVRRELDNLAIQGSHEVALWPRASLTQAWADQTYRFASAGQPTSLRFQVAEEKLDARRALSAGTDLRALLRGQFNRFERQQDLWLATALAELEPRRNTGLAIAPRAGVHYYSGGLGDGRHAGELLGLTARLRGERAEAELVAGRERTKGNGLRRRLDGGGSGFSPRQVGAQLIHSFRVGTRFVAGAFAVADDYEFQKVENTSLGLDFITHRVHGAVSWRASGRLTLDLSGDYNTSENDGIYFANDWRSVAATLSASLVPTAALELRSRGTYGRVPAGSRETYWLLDNQVAWRFPMLDLSLLHRLERRAPDAGLFELARDDRLVELRATRRFWGAL